MGGPVIDLDDPRPLQRAIDAFVDGTEALSGLDLYYELERSTSLLTFHTMLRGGPRNREHNGLQQSYGDHNRLLMFGLDRLVAGDLEWYRGRIDAHDPVDDRTLVACFERVGALGLSREVLVALWLGAALHDCGMLCGRGAYVDVEDGVVLALPIIDALCPPELRALAAFALHHHDYVKGVFQGEVPAALVADDLATLPAHQQPIALAALGCVQVAGSASLGEGRLGAFRVEIFDRCLDGTAFDDRSVTTRWARLVDTGEGPPPADGLVPFLEQVPVHGWQRVSADVSPPARAALLEGLAARWRATGADHLVFRDGFAPFPATATGTAVALDGVSATLETALSGTRVLVLDRLVLDRPARAEPTR